MKCFTWGEENILGYEIDPMEIWSKQTCANDEIWTFLRTSKLSIPGKTGEFQMIQNLRTPIFSQNMFKIEGNWGNSKTQLPKDVKCGHWRPTKSQVLVTISLKLIFDQHPRGENCFGPIQTLDPMRNLLFCFFSCFSRFFNLWGKVWDKGSLWPRMEVVPSSCNPNSVK